MTNTLIATAVSILLIAGYCCLGYVINGLLRADKEERELERQQAESERLGVGV